MPRSRSIFIQSERVLRRSPFAPTCPARLIAPPNSSSFSVSVVLPASGCEMIAKVRRRAASVETSDIGAGAGQARSHKRKRRIIPAKTSRAGTRGSAAAAGLVAGELQFAQRAEHAERDRLETQAAVGLDHEVQVWRGAVAGIARQGDALALPDLLPDPHLCP